MSAYKKLNKQDAYITTYVAHKSWEVAGDDLINYGVQVIPYAAGSFYSSLKQLYYPDKVSGSIVSHSFDYYEQSTLDIPGTREISTPPFVISIPRSATGIYLAPGTNLNIYLTQVQKSRYVSASYVNEGYTNDPDIIINVDVLGIDDDGEGNLYLSGSSPRRYVGDIIYPHGIISVTDPQSIAVLQNMWSTALQQNFVLNWQSSHPIFTHNYHCRVGQSEFNLTYNPSSLTGSLRTVYDNDGNLYATSASVNIGEKRNNITGSEFQPYITTVGLYNDTNELIAVGKMAQPLPKTANTEMTIIVKIDI